MQLETMPNESLTPPIPSEQEQLDAFFALIEAEAVAEGDEAERLKAELDALLTEAEAAA
jgi:cell division septum initiation protein DivIVA